MAPVKFLTGQLPYSGEESKMLIVVGFVAGAVACYLLKDKAISGTKFIYHKTLDIFKEM
jgi:hypothetical protein